MFLLLFFFFFAFSSSYSFSFLPLNPPPFFIFSLLFSCSHPLYNHLLLFTRPIQRKTMTKTTTQKKRVKHPTYAIFLKSWWLTHSKYDDRYLTLVILFTPFTLVTLVTLFQSYIQFYRAKCITVSGFLKVVSNFWGGFHGVSGKFYGLWFVSMVFKVAL